MCVCVFAQGYIYHFYAYYTLIQIKIVLKSIVFVKIDSERRQIQRDRERQTKKERKKERKKEKKRKRQTNRPTKK